MSSLWSQKREAWNLLRHSLSGTQPGQGIHFLFCFSFSFPKNGYKDCLGAEHEALGGGTLL